jgi:hypothetical protein
MAAGLASAPAAHAGEWHPDRRRQVDDLAGRVVDRARDQRTIVAGILQDHAPASAWPYRQRPRLRADRGRPHVMAVRQSVSGTRIDAAMAKPDPKDAPADPASRHGLASRMPKRASWLNEPLPWLLML